MHLRLIMKSISNFKPPELLQIVLMTIFKIVFLIFLLPLFVIFICPCYLARLAVIAVSKILRPDLVAVLGVRDMFYAVDDITTCPKSSVVVTMVCKGNMKREMLIRNISEALTKRKHGEKGLMYPELKRYLVKWMGFIFWKEDKAFSPENHVVYIDPRNYLISQTSKPLELDESILKQIEKRLVQDPFPVKKSPWSIKILQNYKPREFSKIDANGNTISESQDSEYTAVIFQVHHSFVDGFSLLNLLMKEIMKCPNATLSQGTFPKRSFLLSLLLNAFLILKAPYDLLSEALMDVDSNPLYLTRDRITNIINSATSHRIPSQKIKDIAKNTQGSFTGVVISSVSGGIRRYMMEKGEKFDPNWSLTCLAPFPVPGHPDTLGNYLSDCYVEFPIGIADSALRLKKIERQLKEIKNSTVALSSFAMQPIFGGLFHWMVKPLVEFAMSKSTGVFSSFPGPKVPIYGPSGEIVDTYFTAGHDSPGIGLQFLALNYNGCWKLKIQADQGTLSSDAEVENLLSHILHDLDSYDNASIV